MTYLLDTNVVSEWAKPWPDPNVVTWLADVDEDRVMLSVATLAELRHGTARLAKGRRRDRLEQWLTDGLPARFEGRILDIDRAVADAWGMLMARSEDAGRSMSAMDALFAATAHCHSLTLVTRYTDDFAALDVMLLDPWIPNEGSQGPTTDR